jgi:hypothetical protein
MYQTHLLAGKAGFKSPLYLMGEEKRGFGRAIELSGDPGQRFIRGKIRDWAMDSGLAKSAPPKYTAMQKVNIPQFKLENNAGMMQPQANIFTQNTDALDAKNAAQQANINSILAQSKPTNFSSPNLTGLTFGGK